MTTNSSHFEEEARLQIQQDPRRLRYLQAIGWTRTLASSALLAAIELPAFFFWLFVCVGPESNDVPIASALAAPIAHSFILACFAFLWFVNIYVVPCWTRPMDDEVRRLAHVLWARSLAIEAISARFRHVLD